MLFLVFIIVQFASNVFIWWVELQASYLERVDLFLCVCVYGGVRLDFGINIYVCKI